MGVEEQHVQQPAAAVKSPTLEHDQQKPSNPRVSTCSTDKDDGLALCRVCHCVEPDLRGEAALGLLGIIPPSPHPSVDNDTTKTSTSKDAPTFLELISPEGDIFKCAATDIESGHLHPQDDIVNLGCSCKNELALAHYACALKWFISHGSTVCEICGNVATNVRPEDFNMVLASLKDYEALRERTSTGDLSYLHYRADAFVDPVALAAVRRQRLCEISSWFNAHNAHFVFSRSHNNEEVPVSPSNNSVDYSVTAARAAHARRTFGSSGAFVAVSLGFVLLAWFVAPHVGKVDEFKYQYGKPLVKDGSPPLTTMMRKIHQWYMKTCSESRKDALTVLFKEEHDLVPTGLFSIEFDELFQLYNQKALDKLLVTCYCLYLLKIAECRKAQILDIGFIDPNVIHEWTFQKNASETEANLLQSLLKKSKQRYNTFSLQLPRLIKLDRGVVTVLDPRRKDPQAYEDMTEMLKKEAGMIFVDTMFASSSATITMSRATLKNNLKFGRCGMNSYHKIACEQFKRNWRDSFLTTSSIKPENTMWKLI